MAEAQKKPPKAKLDRSLIVWVIVFVFLAFLLILYSFKGPDLGQSKIDAERKKQEMEAAAKALQTRVSNPAQATADALARAQQAVTKKNASAPVVASSVPPAMPPVPASITSQMPPVDTRGEELKFNQLEKTYRTVYRKEFAAQSDRSSGSAPTVQPGQAENAAPFVVYSVNRQSGAGQGGSSSLVSDAIPLYKPIKPAKTASSATREQPAVQQIASPNSAQSAPLAAAHNSEVTVAKADMMAQRANGLYWLAPGTVINAVLLNAVDTLLPGNLTARVTQNVYDSRYGTHLVIPAGSILRGQYQSSVQDGQNRVFMAFDTLVTPSGGIVKLGNMTASDALGRSGMAGDLHTHFWERMGISTLLALEAVGMDKLSPNQSTATIGGTTTSPATDGAQIIVNTANQELQRRYSVQPNITIPAGNPLTIVTTGSIEVPPIANTR